jgi:hypothetical protein
MSAVRAEDGVVMGQMCADPCRNRFLANISMASAVDQALLVAAREFLFRLADKEHCAVEVEQLIVLHWC